MTPTRVLLVEDERIVALHLRQQLAKMGYVVAAVAASGEEALRQIDAQRPDVVLMDIHIEGPIDGIETTSRIPAELHLPVIYLTAYAEEPTLVRARATKPYGYLLKPFSERELHATIQMALERRRADVIVIESEQRLEQLVKTRTAELEEQTAKRLKAEQGLRQAQKLEAIAQLASGVAHDFNNLLMIIVGNLSLLSEPIGEERRRQLVAAALTAAHRGSNLTRQLLSFGRRQMVRPERLDVDGLLRGCDQLVRSAAGQLVHVDYRLQAGPANSLVDREELERAVLNIAINARQAMPNGGTLTVATDAVQVATPADDGPDAGDFVRIIFRDTGHGMAPNVVRRAFDPFFTTKAPNEGSGLGLSQVYGFAKQSGGHAKIESAIGVGTSVLLYLPISVAHDKVKTTTTPAAVRSVAATVLVVDDTTEVLDTVTNMLQTLGCTVLQARGGGEGLAVIRDHCPDVDILLTDIVMPGDLAGHELARAATRICPNINVVLMTGYASDRNADGEHLVLRKPFNKDDLGAGLRATLRKRRVGRWS